MCRDKKENGAQSILAKGAGDFFIHNMSVEVMKVFVIDYLLP